MLLSPLCGLSLDGLVLTRPGAATSSALDDRELLRASRPWFERERRAAAWLGAEQLLDRALDAAATSCTSRACRTRAVDWPTCAS